MYKKTEPNPYIMKLKSQAFKSGEQIPIKYTAHGNNINPPLTVEDIPKDTVSLVLVIEDPDVPNELGIPVWDHWVLFNIPPGSNNITEDWKGGMQGQNSKGKLGYTGPKPPDREHRYYFQAFALDTTLPLKEGAIKAEVLKAMRGHILERAELVGRFAPL